MSDDATVNVEVYPDKDMVRIKSGGIDFLHTPQRARGLADLMDFMHGSPTQIGKMLRNAAKDIEEPHGNA